jgi:NADPH:quinone reductase-like Zn-dependent oxidoreductase
MKAIVITDQAAGTAGMKLAERPEPQAAINDVIVQIHASGFVPTKLAWPSTWTDRRDRDRTSSIPGHELAGVVTALGYGTTGLSVGQRVFGLADWYRDGTLAEYVAIEARNLAPLPGDVDFTVGASLPISGLTAWQGLFDHGRLRAGQSVIAHGAAGAVGSMVTQLAREAEARPDDGLAIDFVVESDRTQLSEIVQRVRDGRLRTNIGNVSTLDKAVAAFNSTERRAGKTVSFAFVREDSGRASGSAGSVSRRAFWPSRMMSRAGA